MNAKGGAMSRAESARFRQYIRRGPDEAFKRRLAEIEEEAKHQKAACSQELQQTIERLDREVADDRAALVAARSEAKRATDVRGNAARRLKVAEETRRAKQAQKRRHCAIEADAIKARKRAERDYDKEIKRLEGAAKKRAKPLSSKGERRNEARDEVEQNIPPEYVPLWRKVSRTFRIAPNARMSLTEAFVHYAGENPGDVVAAQEADVEREMREHERQERKARRQRALADVPF